MLGPGFLLLAHLNATQEGTGSQRLFAQEWRKLVRMLKCDEGEEGLPYIEPKGESNTKDAQGTDAPGKKAPGWNLAVVAVVVIAVV